MSTSVRRPMTLDEFLAWEDRQELRYEFDGAHVVAMTGGASEQSLIQGNLIGALRERLRGRPCRVHGSHLKISAAGSIRYLDAFVVCTPVPRGATVVSEPVVVFEILSPSTSGIDRIVKVREYGDTPSIQRYVILEQALQAATIFSRESGRRAGVVVIGDAALEMPEIDVTLPLAELYEDVTFPADESGE